MTKVTYGEVPDKAYDYSATPEDRYIPFKIRKKRKNRPDYWVAPEHQKFAASLDRGYRYDHKGRKMVELGTEVLMDARPQIMRPERSKIFLGLSDPSA